jgi:hypothetical protein
MFFFMVWLKYTQWQDRANSIGASEMTNQPLEIVPKLKDVLQDPVPFLEYFFKAKK